MKVEKVKFLTREIQVRGPGLSFLLQAAIRKTKAWNTGQLEGLDRNQTTLEEEVDAIERSLHKVPFIQYLVTNSWEKVRVEQEDVEAEAARVAEAAKEEEGEEEHQVEEYEEDFHLWLARAGGPSGGWTQDDHLVLTTLTHRCLFPPTRPAKLPLSDMKGGF